MLVLVATTETQGDQPGDYAWTVDGELVTALVDECDSAGRCGCGRGFPGLASSRATTTAVVVERPELDHVTFRTLLADSLDRAGWSQCLSDDEFEDLVDEHLECIALVCASFPVGTIVNRSGTRFFARPVAEAA